MFSRCNPRGPALPRSHTQTLQHASYKHTTHPSSHREQPLRLKLPLPPPTPPQNTVPLRDRSFATGAETRLNIPQVRPIAAPSQPQRTYSNLSKPPEFAVKKSTAETPVFDEKILQYGKKLHSEVAERDSIVRIPFEGKQRQNFVAWFAQNALDHKDCDLIAANFNDKDWKLLREHLKKDLTGHAPSLLVMKWMTSVANRLKSDKLKHDSSIRHHDPALWLFFRRASEFIEAEKAQHNSLDKQCTLLADALTDENLFQFIDAFTGTLPQKIVRHVVLHHPSKLDGWNWLLLQIPDDDSDHRTSKKIADLFDVISKAGCLDKAIEICFNKTNDPGRTLTTYCSLNTDDRRKVLQHLFSEKGAWINRLMAWTVEALYPASVKNFVPSEFVKDFFELLHEIDPAAATEIKNRWASESLFAQQQEYLNCLLPVGLDLKDPAVRQDLAIRKLKLHFLTPGIPHQDRRNFVYQLNDLSGDKKTDRSWLRTLFARLPVETWPLIFLHFHSHLSSSLYFDYVEEKTRGGVFHTTNKEGVTTGISWMPDVREWIVLAAKTLEQMVDNEYTKVQGCRGLDSQTPWAMQHWYQAVCETNAIHAVIERFIENDKNYDFIYLMDKLAHSAFYHNSEGFLTLMKDCLEKADIDKTTYIADCLLRQRERRLKDNSNFNIIGPVQLEYKLWHAPFLTSDQERSDIAKKIVTAVGDDFVGYFATGYPYEEAALFIKSLKNVDPVFCEKLFVDWIMAIEYEEWPDNTRLKIFHRVCAAYADAGYDVIELLEKERKDMHPLKKMLACIKGAYSRIDCSEDMHFSELGLKLLKCFNPENFHSTILDRIHSMFTEKHIWFFYLNILMENLEKCGEKQKVIDKLKDSPTLLKLIKKGIENNIAQYFESSHIAPTFPLVSQLIPDWKERLTAWAKAEIQSEIERCNNSDWPYNTPKYRKFLSLYNSLHETGLSKQWMASFEKEISPELKGELWLAIKNSKKS